MLICQYLRNLYVSGHTRNRFNVFKQNQPAIQGRRETVNFPRNLY